MIFTLAFGRAAFQTIERYGQRLGAAMDLRAGWATGDEASAFRFANKV